MLDSVSGDHVCTGCGLVLAQRAVSDEAEWRTFDDDPAGGEGDAQVRVHAPAEAHRRLSAQVATRLVSGQAGDMTVAVEKAHKSLIQHTCSWMGLPYRVVDTALAILVTTAECSGNLPRCAAKVASAAAVFGACKMEQVPRTLKEVQTATGVSSTLIGRCYLRLKCGAGVTATAVAGAKPSAFVSRLGSSLSLEYSVIQQAKDNADRAMDTGAASGMRVHVLAAACLVLMGVPLPDAATAADVSQGAVTAAVQTLKPVCARTES